MHKGIAIPHSLPFKYVHYVSDSTLFSISLLRDVLVFYQFLGKTLGKLQGKSMEFRLCKYNGMVFYVLRKNTWSSQSSVEMVVYHCGYHDNGTGLRPFCFRNLFFFSGMQSNLGSLINVIGLLR